MMASERGFGSSGLCLFVTAFFGQGLFGKATPLWSDCRLAEQNVPSAGRGASAQPPAEHGLCDQFLQPLSSCFLLFRAHHPPADRLPIRRRLSLEELPRRLVLF